MALDKVKTLRAAEKYLEIGKIAAAIKEYCQIVSVDSDDFTTLNMLGDLYTRVGKTAEAVSCFRRIAEHYHEQGFGLKAIAMYKKIDRLQPGDIEIISHLAGLYAQQDLVVEARTHYLAIVEAYNRAGATESALETLRKIADLDPQNTQIRIKLADSFLKQGMSTDAAACLAEAGQVMVARGEFDEALEVFGKGLAINPDDYAGLKGLLTAHSARGTADEAAQAIEVAWASHPEDRELLSLLGTAYIEADDPEQAERVTALLVTKEPGAYLRFMEVARLYLRQDKSAEAVNVVGKISEQMLAEREQEKLLTLIDELLARDADNVQALRLLARAHWWLRDIDNLKGALERLAEAAQAAGLDQDERYALTQLTRLEPERDDYLARLNELGGAEETAASEAMPDVEAAADADLSPAEQFVFSAEDVVTGIEETTFDWDPVTEVSKDWTAPNEAQAETGFTFESIVAEELPGNTVESADSQAAEDRVAAMLRQELESVDFYIAQGYIDIALDTLALLEQQCGLQPEIELRREQIKKVQSGEPAGTPDAVVVEPRKVAPNDAVEVEAIPTAPAPEMAPPVSAAPVSNNKSSQAMPGIDAGLAEIFEEYRASSEREVDGVANGDYETHYNLGLAYKEMDLFEDALEEFQIAVSLTSATDGTPRYLQCCNLLGHCFMQTGVPELAVKWFTKGLSSTSVTDEERMALTYEIGAAHEQAGDLHRALESFTEVYGNNVSYRNVNERVRTLKARLGENATVTPRAARSEQLVN